MSKEWDTQIKMEISHREIEVFKACLPDFIKRLKKSSKIETHVFGTSTFQETIEYCEHIQRRIDAALDNETMAVSE